MNYRNKRTKAVHAGRSPHQMACGARMNGLMYPTAEPVTCECCDIQLARGFEAIPAMLSVYEAADVLIEQGYPVTRETNTETLRELLAEVEAKLAL